MVVYQFTARLLRSDGQHCNLPVPTELRYDADHDPLAVEMVLQAPDDETVTWRFARDLLVAATNTNRPTGSGDVKLRTEGNLLFVCLESDEGHADLGFPAERVREFLAETTEEAAQCLATLNDAVDRFLEEVLSGE